MSFGSKPEVCSGTWLKARVKESRNTNRKPHLHHQFGRIGFLSGDLAVVCSDSWHFWMKHVMLSGEINLLIRSVVVISHILPMSHGWSASWHQCSFLLNSYVELLHVFCEWKNTFSRKFSFISFIKVKVEPKTTKAGSTDNVGNKLITTQIYMAY